LRRSVLMATTVALVGGIAQSAHAAAPANPPRPAAQLSSFEGGTFAVLAKAAVKPVPKFVQRLAKTRFGTRYGVNPALARLAVAPDSDAAHPWYVVPGATGLCLIAKTGYTCQTDAGAAAGKLWLQLIPPYGNDPSSPLPPPEVGIQSRVVGVTPRGVTGITAATKSGAVVTGLVAGGMYAISGLDMTTLQLVRSPLGVPVFSGTGT
jgi:hypothetical protein